MLFDQYPLHPMLNEPVLGIWLLAIGPWIGMCPKRVQTDGIEVHIFNYWGRAFSPTLDVRRKHAAPAAVDDPLVNSKGASLTSKLTIRRGQRQENWKKLKLGPSYILPETLFTSGLFPTWANKFPHCLTTFELTFLLFAAESILTKTTALWGRN